MAKKLDEVFAFTPKMLEDVTDNGETIVKQIRGIKRQNSIMLKAIAVCAASCVCHAVQHGDVTKATMLVDALEGWRRNDLRQWFLDHGPFMWVTRDDEGQAVEGGGKFKLNKEKLAGLKEEYKRNKRAFITPLLETPFWLYKKEAPFKPMNLIDELIRVIVKAERVRKDPEKAKVSKLDHLEEIKRFIRSFQNEEGEETDVVEEEKEAA